MSNVLALSCSEDARTGRCRLPEWLLHGSPLGTPSLIKLRTALGAFSYISTAWPLVNPAGLTQDAANKPLPIQLDPAVLLHHPLKGGVTAGLREASASAVKAAYLTPALVGLPATAELLGLNEGVTWPPRRADSVRLAQVLFPGDLPAFNASLSTFRLRQRLALAFEGFVVQSGCWVRCELEEFGGAVCFLVQATEPPYGFLRMDPDTNVSLMPPHPVSLPCQERAGQPPPPGQTLLGLDAVRETLAHLLVHPLIHSAAYTPLGLLPPQGVLLHGPPGVGKTSIVRNVCEQAGLRVVEIDCSRLAKAQGDHDELVQAFQQAAASAPCIVVLDEMDGLCVPRAETVSTVALVGQWLDAVGAAHPRQCSVVGITNRVHDLSSRLRRAGRFDREIFIGPPDLSGRQAILQHFLGAHRHCVDLQQVAADTVGYVGADLGQLVREAERRAAGDALQEEAGEVIIRPVHVQHALAIVPPSLKRSVHVELRGTTTWDDIGGLEDVKRKLQQSVEWPLKHPEAFARLGLKPYTGILLYGPPGCAKTSLMRALAAATHSTILCVDSAKVFSAYVGDSEQYVRDVFRQARLSRPSIVFWDELEAVASARERSGGPGVGSDVGSRVLSTLLNELDGIETTRSTSHDVLFVGATNRKDLLDPAVLRPGRLDCLIEVPLPDETTVAAIVEVCFRRMPVDPAVDPQAVARRLVGCSGADVENVCREAALAALRRAVGTGGRTPRLPLAIKPPVTGCGPATHSEPHIQVEMCDFECAWSRGRAT